MKKLVKRALLVVLLTSSCVNFCYAQDSLALVTGQSETNQNPNSAIENISSLSGGKSQEATVGLPKQLTNVLIAPPETDKKAKTPSKKIDLQAVIFDPDANFKAEATEEGREMTKLEEAQYNLHEALHGEVEAISTKGLWADKMKINLEKGPIESISPWMDYSGNMSGTWNGGDYKNTLYNTYFADFGAHVKMRDGKTAFKFMFSPVKGNPDNNYMRTFFADNFVTRKVGKNNTILVGNTWLPIGFEGNESPLVWQFMNRSQTSMKYTSVRALGAKVMGNYKWADYQTGIYSSGRGFTDFFPGPEFAGWVSFKPLAATNGKYGKLQVGTGFNAGNAQSSYAVLTGAVKYDYKRFQAVTEFGTANGSNGATGFTTNKSQGINGTLSYRVTPKLQTLIRYDQFDPNTQKDNDIRTEYTAGINYFVKGQALRFMLNYTMYTVQNGLFGNRILVGTQIVL